MPFFVERIGVGGCPDGSLPSRRKAAWFHGEGDPIPLLEESLESIVPMFYQHGPILRAISDAAPMDERLEKTWTGFVKDFDDAVTHRIEQQ